jgi:hypothetical protein
VGKPRFKPARVFANPRHFARRSQPAWADPCPLTPTEAAWAIFQHRASRAVLQELRANEKTIEDLAATLGEDPSWLQRKLHGQTPVDLGDVMAWALEFGVHIIPVFDKSSEMKPSIPSSSNELREPPVP